MIILVGKMASGKTTIAKLMEKKGYKRVVTDTTRRPREGERDGIDYRFLSEAEFLKNKEAGIYAETTEYNAAFGHVYYGSRKSDYSDEHAVIVLNPYGVKAVKESGIPGRVVFLNCSEETIHFRLKDRGDTAEEITRRLTADEKDFRDIDRFTDIKIDISDTMSPEDVLSEIENSISHTLDITRTLTISTAHVSFNTLSLLDNWSDEYNPDAPIVFIKGPYGFLIYTENYFYDDGAERFNDLPEDLRACISFAHRHNCEWLCLDRDGDVIPDLSEY